MRKSWLIYLEVVIIIAMMAFMYYHEGIKLILTKSNAINATVQYILFLLLIDFMSRVAKYLYSKSQRTDRHHKNNVHFGIDNIAKLLVGLGLVISLFSFFGVDIKSLLTSLSIVAAAIAIISKEFINDFLIGLYFSFSRNFEINDYVKLADQKGKIVEIGMLKVTLLNDDDDAVIIPNSKIYTFELTNYTKRDIRLMSIDFQLDIKLIQGIEQLEEELISSLTPYSEFIESESYNLKIVEMKMNYIDLKFQYKIKRIDRVLQKKIRKLTVRKIFDFISRKGSSSIPVTE